MSEICTVCKQPIDSALVVHTSSGPVHPGPCYNYVVELPVSENTQEHLNETELLLQSSVDSQLVGFAPSFRLGPFCIRSLLPTQIHLLIQILNAYQPTHRGQKYHRCPSILYL